MTDAAIGSLTRSLEVDWFFDAGCCLCKYYEYTCDAGAGSSGNADSTTVPSSGGSQRPPSSGGSGSGSGSCGSIDYDTDYWGGDIVPVTSEWLLIAMRRVQHYLPGRQAGADAMAPSCRRTRCQPTCVSYPSPFLWCLQPSGQTPRWRPPPPRTAARPAASTATAGWVPEMPALVACGAFEAGSILL